MVAINRMKLLAALSAVLAAGVARADVKPASVFTDHMVLQQGAAVPVWGTADAGETVTVTLGSQKQTATAGADGKWMVKLTDLKASMEPVEVNVAGKNTVKFSDVLVGEVWLASGQSNMEFPVAKATARWAGLINEEQEIAAANYPKIRMFTARNAKTYEPKPALVGDWKVCTPQTVPAFSAVGYLFARDLQKELNVPVGIITVAAGASVAEAWMSRESFASDAKLKFMLERFDTTVKFFREHPDAPGTEAPKRVRTINKGNVPPQARQPDPVQDQHYPTVQFNGMVAPVIPYAIKGAIWYQGESICYGTPGVNMYGDVQKALVNDWRKQWNNPNLPFYIVQLPGQQNISNHPLIREQQARVLELPHTGMAVTIDVGEAKDVHPHNKAPVANRLVKLALAGAYGQKVDAVSPMYESMKVEANAVRIAMSHSTNGLKAKGGELKGFVIAGEDQKFVPAAAKIEGNSIVVSSPDVKAPAAVRYAWDNYPEGMGANLVGASDLPAAPFRTDKWAVAIEGITED